MGVLPSKKFILVLLIILLIGGGWLLLFKNKAQNSGAVVKYQKDETEFIDFLRKNTKDSDNDGLKDWEEVLWKTDPNNPDTDGDGTLDGEEVKENRNPTIAGPDDLFERVFQTTYAVSNDEILFSETDSLTKKSAIRFFTEYIKFKNKEGGGELSESAKEELVKSLISDFESEIIDDYNISDISVSDDNSKEAIKKYGNELGAIMDKYRFLETEITIFERAVENKDSKELDKLGAISDIYSNAAKDILKLIVPSGFKDEHLVFVNNFMNISQSLKDMQKAFEDPLVAFIGMDHYRKLILDVYNAFRSLKSEFINKNIIFNDNEPGSIIINELP